MFLRSAAMTAALSLGGAAFVAGAAAGAGLAVVAVGGACLARRAVQRRNAWGAETELAAAPSMPEAHPERPE